MLHFRCLGIPVRVEPFFWLTLTILGGLNFGGGVGSSPNQILLIALFVIAGFISILVHEMGHAMTARRFGAQVQIVLQAFGGYARYTSAGITRKRSIAITAAGPVVQMLLGGLSYLLFIAMIPPEFRAHPLHYLTVNRPDLIFLLSLTAISWIWAVFNLLPILPLDGGRIVQAALGPARIRTTLWISLATCAAFTLYGLATKQLFLIMFMGMFGYQSWQALQQTRFR